MLYIFCSPSQKCFSRGKRNQLPNIEINNKREGNTIRAISILNIWAWYIPNVTQYAQSQTQVIKNSKTDRQAVEAMGRERNYGI